MVLSLTRRAGENINVTGLLPNTLKKLNGDKLALPSLSMVEAKQIGRGETEPKRYACSCAVLIEPGVIVIKKNNNFSNLQL
jgi:hypothetical protein